MWMNLREEIEDTFSHLATCIDYPDIADFHRDNKLDIGLMRRREYLTPEQKKERRKELEKNRRAYKAKKQREYDAKKRKEAA